jgi:CheY-like chemotaxis protein
VAVDVVNRLTGMRDLLTSSLGGAVNLVISAPYHLWPVETDVAELELALVNIAVNARDAMPNGGVLRVEARNVSLDADEVSLNGDFVALSLADNGTGIASDVLKKIFEPFFTTKEVGKGTGLGLSQVYGFARQNGGDVQVASKLGEGTTVTIYLPRSQSEPAAPSDAAPPQDKMEGTGTVLLVEDNIQVGDVSTMLLESLGYRVLRAERPAAAVEMLKREPGVQLVLSDIVMPGDMDGLSFARELRKLYPGLPVLLATGYSSAAERVGSEFPIIRKPYDNATVGMAVKNLMAQCKLRRAETE